MRTEKNKDGTRKVWITREEFDVLLNEAESGEERIALLLMGKVGLRVSEVLSVCYADVRRSSDGEDFLIEVDGAKDVSGEYDGGKQRDVYLPDEVEREMFEFVHEKDIDEDECIVSVTTERAVQGWIESLREQAYDTTANGMWNYLSCHDLRRSLVTHLIHNEGVQLSIVQEQFGWDDIATVKQYLDDPTEEVIQREFDDVSL